MSSTTISGGNLLISDQKHFCKKINFANLIHSKLNKLTWWIKILIWWFDNFADLIRFKMIELNLLFINFADLIHSKLKELS